MLDTSFIIGYILLVLLIGYFSSRKQTGERFMLDNRNLGVWEFVSTIVASMFGGTAMVVYVAYVFEFGLGVITLIAGVGLGFAVFGLCAHPLRKLAHEHNFHTIADFFHHRFTKTLGHLVAIIMVAILLLVILKQFIVGTQILSAITAWNYELSLLMTMGVVLVYLLLGGFRSVIKTDVFQYLMLFFLAFAVGLTMANQVQLPMEAILQDNTPISIMISFLVLGLLIVWYSPDVWQRVYAAKNDRVVKRGMIFSALILVIIALGLALIGLAARVAFPEIDPSQALVFGITNLLPPGLLGLGIVLVFAAVMSSADTLIFVLATNVAKDFIRPLKGGHLSSAQLMAYTRLSLIGIVITASLLAYFFRSVVDLALVNTAFGMSLAPTIIASFKWKLKNRAALISIIAALIYSFYWILQGIITPEAMVSPVLVSGIILALAQKFSR